MRYETHHTREHMETNSRLKQAVARAVLNPYAALFLPMIAVFVVLLLWISTLSTPAGNRSPVWLEVSRGEFLRAIRHVPTDRCFVRYRDGGLIETVAEVCRPSGLE